MRRMRGGMRVGKGLALKVEREIVLFSEAGFHFLGGLRNQLICVHLEQTRQVADRLAQSKLKKEATAVFNCADRRLNRSFPQAGQIKGLSPISIRFGSSCLLIWIV